jgi:hypothetical protein
LIVTATKLQTVNPATEEILNSYETVTDAMIKESVKNFLLEKGFKQESTDVM